MKVLESWIRRTRCRAGLWAGGKGGFRDDAQVSGLDSYRHSPGAGTPGVWMMHRSGSWNLSEQGLTFLGHVSWASPFRCFAFTTHRVRQVLCCSHFSDEEAETQPRATEHFLQWRRSVSSRTHGLDSDGVLLLPLFAVWPPEHYFVFQLFPFL